jgi:hypothetical protein
VWETDRVRVPGERERKPKCEMKSKVQTRKADSGTKDLSCTRKEITK